MMKTTSLLLLTVIMSANAQEKKQLGKEYPPADEAQTIVDLKNGIAATTKTPLGPNGLAIRTAHTWSHGLVKAKFVIEKNLPKELQVGVFKPGKSYEALVRFSNSTPAAPKPDDATADARGMAVRLLNVPGKKLLSDDKNSTDQDFMTMSHPTFNSTSAAEFTKFITTVGNPDKAVVGAYFADPANRPFFGRVAEANIVVENVLNIPYFSTTPYRFGNDKTKAVKYKIQPSKSEKLEVLSTTSPNYLRENMLNNLSKEEVSFDFYVQFQEDADAQPIEDPTIEWKTPFVKIATIIIPKQVFDTPEMNKMAENITFNPWHSLKAHQPLGGINRARKTVYEAMQKIRHQQNGIPAK